MAKDKTKQKAFTTFLISFKCLSFFSTNWKVELIKKPAWTRDDELQPHLQAKWFFFYCKQRFRAQTKASARHVILLKESFIILAPERSSDKTHQCFWKRARNHKSRRRARISQIFALWCRQPFVSAPSWSVYSQKAKPLDPSYKLKSRLL